MYFQILDFNINIVSSFGWMWQTAHLVVTEQNVICFFYSDESKSSEVKRFFLFGERYIKARGSLCSLLLVNPQWAISLSPQSALIAASNTTEAHCRLFSFPARWSNFDKNDSASEWWNFSYCSSVALKIVMKVGPLLWVLHGIAQRHKVVWHHWYSYIICGRSTKLYWLSSFPDNESIWLWS